MHLTIVTLVAPRSEATKVLEHLEIVETLWAAADPGVLLEHISAQAGPGRVRLGFFTKKPPDKNSNFLIFINCHRALITSPLLTGWSISQITIASSLDYSVEDLTADESEG
jgi:hypothetical protein